MNEFVEGKVLLHSRGFAKSDGNLLRNIMFRRGVGNYRSEGKYPHDEGNSVGRKPYDAKVYEAKNNQVGVLRCFV